jgi:hypothetical protein
MTTVQTKSIQSYCDRHGHTPASGLGLVTCLNCGDPLTAFEQPKVTAGTIDTEPAPTGIDATLAERGSRYGVWADQARITQNIKRAMADSPNWAALPDDMVASLDMIASKIARILNGDPTYADSWHDIIGYAKLVENRLTAE